MPGPSAAIGRLSFEFQPFSYGADHSRKRPVKVSGTLSHIRPVPAYPPLAYFSGGDTSATVDLSNGFDKGHIILVSHSGVSSPENIVPMYPCFNQAGGIWREMELRVASYVGTTLVTVASPRVVDMTVEIEYGGTIDPRFPTAFLVTVKDTDRDMGSTGGYLYFKGMPLNRYRIAHLPTPPAVIDPVADLGVDLATAINSAYTYVNTSGWKIEDQYHSGNPPLVAPLSDVPSRPYAMLDYLWLVSGDPHLTAFLTTGCTYVHRHASEFHERQKMLIRAVNAMRNAGKLKSDYPGDTTDDLIIGSGQRSAQVDHVFPYDSYGGNLFSNALIASGAFNNRMRTAAPAIKWGDTTGVTLYSVTQHT